MILTGANLRFSGFCGISSFSYWFHICGIWSVLYYNFYTKLHIYMNFRINLTLFYFNFSIQEHKIDVLYVLFNAWDSHPLSFFLYSPFKQRRYGQILTNNNNKKQVVKRTLKKETQTQILQAAYICNSNKQAKYV